jgi:hypothetical protein
MHKRIRDFIHTIKITHPELFKSGKVIEFGSRNINGSVREFFATENYTGVDAVPGEGVDKLSLCHEFKGKDNSYDVVISTEMLEHDPYWDLSIERMTRLIKVGGNLIISTAGRHRHPHGQSSYTPLDKYYRNLTATNLAKFILKKARFKKFILENVDDIDLLTFCYWRY